MDCIVVKLIYQNRDFEPSGRGQDEVHWHVRAQAMY